MVLGLDLGPHADFIEVAYLIAIAIVAALIAWVILDRRRQSRSLADLEARGLTRRSERGGAPSGKVEPGLRSENATMPRS
jgi:heme exporter protein D